MDNEKIKELAEQYADKECAMSSHKGRKLLQLHEDKIIEFYDVLGFLSKTHCIVEKKVIQDDYADVKKAVADWESSELTERDDYFEYGRVFGNKEVLESYFSKDDLIGKDVEK